MLIWSDAAYKVTLVVGGLAIAAMMSTLWQHVLPAWAVATISVLPAAVFILVHPGELPAQFVRVAHVFASLWYVVFSVGLLVAFVVLQSTSLELIVYAPFVSVGAIPCCIVLCRTMQGAYPSLEFFSSRFVEPTIQHSAVSMEENKHNRIPRWRKLIGFFNRPSPFQLFVADLLRSHEQSLRKQLDEIRTVGPVGVWWHADNEPVIDSGVWTFWKEGKGQFQHYGTFGNADCDSVEFLWHFVREGHLEVRNIDDLGDSNEEARSISATFICEVRLNGQIASLVMEDCDANGTGYGLFGDWLCCGARRSPVHWQSLPVPLSSEVVGPESAEQNRI